MHEYERAVSALSTLLETDNCDEDAWFFLMKCHLARGNRTAAVKTYHQCRDCLEKELDITPDASIENLFRTIR